jgi:hypothetical protein
MCNYSVRPWSPFDKGNQQRAIDSFCAHDLYVVSAGWLFAEKDSHGDFFVEVDGWRWWRICLDGGVLLPEIYPLGLPANDNLQRLAHTAAKTFFNGLEGDLVSRTRSELCFGNDALMRFGGLCYRC